MIRNFLMVATRNFFRNRIFSVVNIAGLALGFTVSIFILLYVKDEMSYDRFHEHADRIFRINARGVFGNTKINQTFTCAPLPGVLVSDYPDVEKAVRILGRNNVEVRYNEMVFNEDQLIAADSNFFEIFSFPLLYGDPHTALWGKYKILLSESTAKKYFGNEDPLGRVLRIDSVYDFEVTGIFKDIPPQSHIHFNFIGSLSTFNPDQNQNWMSNNYITYLLLREGADPASLESKFPELIHMHIWPQEGAWEKLREEGNNWEYFLQPLTEIHLTSDLNGEFEPNGRKEYIYIFLFSAVFVLVIAAINFTNLTTAKSEKRAREVGVRKVLGSNRRILILQFLLESVLTSVISMVLAFTMVVLLLEVFNELSGKIIKFSVLASPQFLMGSLTITIMIGIMAGLYPSFYLSSFQPALVMKSGRGSARDNRRFRGVLVIFQFFISITLVIGTLVIYRQLKFFQNTNLGFEKEKVLVVHGTDKLRGKFNVFRDHLLDYSQITHVSGTGWVPGGKFYNWGVTPEGWEGNNFTTLNMVICDTAFLKTMEMSMVQGRFFSPDFLSDSTAIIINEEAAKVLDWDSPVGKKISIWGQFDFEVIGVIRDFHYESMHQSIRPMGMINFTFPAMDMEYPPMAAVKVSGADPQGTVQYIEDQWNDLARGIPFRYSFTDSDYQALYENETKTGNVFLIYSILSILIASLGLFALSSYIIEMRTREIGIRKVNGASSGNIVVLLTGEFTRWVFIAILLAIPLGFWLMSEWLENFAYKTDLNIWIFAGAAIIGLLVAGLTISLQTIRASRQNPAASLRYE